MKRFLLYFFSITVLALIITTSLWYIRINISEENSASLAPIPDFLNLSKNSQVKFLDLWLPLITDRRESRSDDQKITAQSALVYDLSTNQPLYERQPNKKLPMASLTKIMTAIISLENKNASDRYIVSEKNLVGEDSMGLSAGETHSLKDLLYGLMLPSGNDAAEVLASNYPTERDGFIKAMNLKAKSLGLTDTLFDNPSGLQGDGVQYTTAHDLLVITRYALENFPEFKKIVSSAQYSIPATSTHKAYELYNETNLLSTYGGVRGVKTGYTPEAGLCLVTYIDYKGHKLIGILLNSENRKGEMKALLDYSLNTIGITPPVYKG